MKRVALCIPTYNRSEVIDELLIRYGAILCNLGYDIYIFDSSNENHTREIIEKKYYDCEQIKYRRFPEEMHSNKKVFEIYKNLELCRNYQYIWVCSDAVRFSEEALGDIYFELEKDNDFAFPNPRDDNNIGTKTYEDCVDIFRDIAWHTQLFGATIVNTQSVLSNIDWEYYENKYLTQERIHYSHVGFFFERMFEMDKVRAIHIHINPDDYSSSPLRKHSGWHLYTFKFICEFWPNVINALPYIYNQYKNLVIRMGCEKSGILVEENLKSLKNENIFNFKILLKYWFVWKNVTLIPRYKLTKIVLLPVKKAETEFEKEIDKLKIELTEFSNVYPYIYIYGCGYIGNCIAEYLEKWGIEYAGFIVSDIEHEKKVFRNHPVKQYSISLFSDNHTGCIMGLNKKYVENVLKNLGNDKLSERVYITFFSKDSNWQ